MGINIRAVYCGPIQENAWLAWRDGRRDCAVVDPGDDYPGLKREIGEMRVAAILLTHGHFDHVMAAGRLAQDTGAPVYIAAEDMEMVNDAGLNGYQLMMGRERMDCPPVCAQPYEDALSVAGLDFRILRTPGHSRGSVCLYLPGDRVLFSGDTLFEAGYGRMDLHGGSPTAMARSLKALFTLPPEVRVCPGHGGETTIGDERARYF